MSTVTCNLRENVLVIAELIKKLLGYLTDQWAQSTFFKSRTSLVQILFNIWYYLIYVYWSTTFMATYMISYLSYMYVFVLIFGNRRSLRSASVHKFQYVINFTFWNIRYVDNEFVLKQIKMKAFRLILTIKLINWIQFLKN